MILEKLEVLLFNSGPDEVTGTVFHVTIKERGIPEAELPDGKLTDNDV